MEAVWEVEVHGGEPVDISTAPLKFGTPVVFIHADEGTRQGDVPLVYGPVAVHTEGSWAGIQTLGENIPGTTSYKWHTHREMAHVLSMEFSIYGSISIYGLERRQDGSAVFAAWTVRPYQPDELQDPENAG